MKTRYLFHSEEAAVENGRFVFTLDKRIHNPVRFRLTRAGFTRTTSTDAAPHAVYLRSDALSELCTRKHTVQAKSVNHHDPSNVLAVLEERHATERYSMLGATPSFPCMPHGNKTQIDFYFTNNNTVLPPSYAAPEVPGTSDVDMDALIASGDLLYWVDMDLDGAVLNNALVQASVGESVNRIISREPGGPLTFITSGADKIQFAAMGPETFGIMQQDAAAWAYSIDSTYPNLTDVVTGSHIFLLKSPPNPAGLEVIWQSSSLHMFWWSNTLQYKNAAEAYVQTGLTVLPATDYLLEVAYTPTESNWHLTKLSDSSTESALAQEALRSPTATEVKMISTAQSHQLGVFSHYAMCTPAAVAQVKSYFTQRYTGATTESAPDPDAVDATFFAEIEITARQ